MTLKQENVKTVQIIMFENRIGIRNPGGIYGRIRIDQLGKVQPDTRNPIIALELDYFPVDQEYGYLQKIDIQVFLL